MLFANDPGCIPVIDDWRRKCSLEENLGMPTRKTRANAVTTRIEGRSASWVSYTHRSSSCARSPGRRPPSFPHQTSVHQTRFCATVQVYALLPFWKPERHAATASRIPKIARRCVHDTPGTESRSRAFASCRNADLEKLNFDGWNCGKWTASFVIVRALRRFAMRANTYCLMRLPYVGASYWHKDKE